MSSLDRQNYKTFFRPANKRARIIQVKYCIIISNAQRIYCLIWSWFAFFQHVLFAVSVIVWTVTGPVTTACGGWRSCSFYAAVRCCVNGSVFIRISHQCHTSLLCLVQLPSQPDPLTSLKTHWPPLTHTRIHTTQPSAIWKQLGPSWNTRHRLREAGLIY